MGVDLATIAVACANEISSFAVLVCSPSTIFSKAAESEAVCDRRLKYAQSLSPASCSRKDGLLEDGCCAFDAYMIVREETARGVVNIGIVLLLADADDDWIPVGRNDKDNGENASTSMLLAVNANAKSSDTSDDEGVEKDLMMAVMVEEKRRTCKGVGTVKESGC
jgi:hypothetical protein